MDGKSLKRALLLEDRKDLRRYSQSEAAERISANMSPCHPYSYIIVDNERVTTNY